MWNHLNLIQVARDGEDTGPLREAIRHVKTGGVLGVFPEGRIVTPPREVRPWHEGVGLIAGRTGAPVLLVWVSGTPDTNEVMASVTTPSQAHVCFIEMLRFEVRDSAAITRQLRQRVAEVSGWPINDDPLPPVPESEMPDPFGA